MSAGLPRRVINGVRVSNLFDPAGKPFGWAHHEERRIIRAHLDRKYGRLEPGTWDWSKRELETVARIQSRLHRHDKSFRELQAIYASGRPPQTEATVLFTFEELERLSDLFAGANDPLTASIAAKAAAALHREGR